MQIRALTPTDAVEFVSIRLRGLAECPEAFPSTYDEESSTPLTEIEHRLQPNPGTVIFGAFAGTTLCAVVGLQRESMVKLAHKALIWGVYVVPEFRTRRTGTRILGHALNHAMAVMGTRQVNLGVNTTNLAAFSLYKKLGFTEYGLERGFLQVGGRLYDEYQMVYCAQSSA